MTIAVGFKCHDGILLASDTLYTATIKTYGRKLWPLQAGETLVGFGGAGPETALERIQYEIGHRLRAGMSEHDIVSMIDQVFKRVFAFVREKPNPTESDYPGGLFAIRAGLQCSLYESDSAGMLGPVKPSGQCIGWGMSLGQYFIASLYRAPMPMRWARIVAAHLVRQAKLYSGDCDGETHLLEVPMAGPARFVSDQLEIKGYESHLAQIDNAMRVALPDGRANDDTLEERVKMIADAITKASKNFWLKAGGYASGSSEVLGVGASTVGGVGTAAGRATVKGVGAQETSESPENPAGQGLTKT